MIGYFMQIKASRQASRVASNHHVSAAGAFISLSISLVEPLALATPKPGGSGSLGAQSKG